MYRSIFHTHSHVCQKGGQCGQNKGSKRYLESRFEFEHFRGLALQRESIKGATLQNVRSDKF